MPSRSRSDRPETTTPVSWRVARSILCAPHLKLQDGVAGGVGVAGESGRIEQRRELRAWVADDAHREQRVLDGQHGIRERVERSEGGRLGHAIWTAFGLDAGGD